MARPAPLYVKLEPMTETAKQGTTKAPAPTAETAPAAPPGAAKPETAAASETETAPEAAAQEGAAQPGPDADGEAAKPDLDETKRKFREALERKHQAHNDGQGQGGRDGGKISGAHGPAASRRNFRRKSG
jgi:hypothetical protein